MTVVLEVLLAWIIMMKELAVLHLVTHCEPQCAGRAEVAKWPLGATQGRRGHTLRAARLGTAPNERDVI
jgi:hypothetical protein